MASVSTGTAPHALWQQTGQGGDAAPGEDLAVKSNIVKNHVNSKKHKTSKEKYKEKVARERDLAEALHAHDRMTHRKGETLPEEHNVYCAKVVMAFIKSGIPLSKLDSPDLRCLLEDNGYRLNDHRHMPDIIPFVVNDEHTCLYSELQGKFKGVVFDSTNRLGEVLAIAVQFIDAWHVQ